MIQWQTVDAVSTPVNTGDYAAGNAGCKVEIEHGSKVKKLFGYQLNALKYFDDPFWINNSNRTNDPQLRQTFSLNVKFKNWSMFEQSTYRKNDLFPGAEANTSLEAIIIHDIGIGYLYVWGQHTIHTQITVENIQNTPNHFLRAYAMPGRVIKLNLILKRTPKNN